jgi:hypothetical protein
LKMNLNIYSIIMKSTNPKIVERRCYGVFANTNTLPTNFVEMIDFVSTVNNCNSKKLFPFGFFTFV